jgi:ring-1,2-phenylacetyl-CoA epoxidase subunit PaaC
MVDRKDDSRDIFANKILSMADDELILGHRDSEWCGMAPILEEDIAFANIALDEIGHANRWYGLLADHYALDKQKYPDRMVFLRETVDFRNCQLVELPVGDWAFSMLRQYLFDAAEKVNLEALTRSRHPHLAEVAHKIRNEEIYHLRHTSAWVRRLSLGTDESHQRAQNALDELWPYACQILLSQPGEGKGVTFPRWVPDSDLLYQEWLEIVTKFMEDINLLIPNQDSNQLSPKEVAGNHRKQHTFNLSVLLADMQSVARLDKEATW